VSSLKEQIRWKLQNALEHEESSLSAQRARDGWLDSLTTTIFKLANQMAARAPETSRFAVVIQTVSREDWNHCGRYRKAENFARDYYIARGYEVEWRLSRKDNGIGGPDFIARKEAEKLNIEVKSANDGWRFSQAKWTDERPQEAYVIHWVVIA